MRLIFVRHGEPDYEHDCLTENGREQAFCTAQRLRNENIGAIYASPMGRAVETASYTAKEYGLDVIKLDFMHEIDWGDRKDSSIKLPYDGHPWTLGYKILAEAPGYVGSGEWDKHPYFRDNVCLDYYESISSLFDGFLEKYGLERRNGLYFCLKENNDTIALFAHGGSGSIMFSHVLSLPFPFVLTTMPYGVCSISIIDLGGRKGSMIIPRLELFNDMGHIKSFKAEKLHFEK